MGEDFFLFRMFAPKYEAVRRETFEQSKAYNQGQTQQLARYYDEYSHADKGHKDAIRSIVLHEFADYDDSKLPSYLQQFLTSLRS